jgi:hypothetical protein
MYFGIAPPSDTLRREPTAGLEESNVPERHRRWRGADDQNRVLPMWPAPMIPILISVLLLLAVPAVRSFVSARGVALILPSAGWFRQRV